MYGCRNPFKFPVAGPSTKIASESRNFLFNQSLSSYELAIYLFSIVRDSPSCDIASRSQNASRNARQIKPLTWFHGRRETLTRRSVFVPRVPTGFPARRYSWLSIIARPPARLRHGLTRSDQPGVTTTHLPDLPRGQSRREKNERKRKKKKKRADVLVFSSVRFQRERSSVLRLSPSFVRSGSVLCRANLYRESDSRGWILRISIAHSSFDVLRTSDEHSTNRGTLNVP